MIDSIDLLKNAVVEQAAHDYRVALIREHDGYKEKNKDMKVSTLEKFFKSEEFKHLTNLDGVKLMKAIKAEVIECNYNMKAIRDSHKKK